jgi:hypothetical protein
MRRAAMAALIGGLVTVSAEEATAQKSKGVAATAQFNGTLAIAGGPYAGILNGSFQADLSRANQTVCFATPFAGDPALVPSAAPGNCYRASLVTVHGVSSLPLQPDYGARQLGIRFADARGYSYLLQYGDAYENPPDYARGTCLVQAANTCTSASLDSAEGTFPGQANEQRLTGNEAQLTVQIGRNSKPALVGIFALPFQVAVVAQ